MPDPYRRNIKYRTGTFLHWYGIFMLYPILHVGRDGHGTVVATGGLAPYIMPCCKRKVIYDADLLFKGLALIWEKNKR